MSLNPNKNVKLYYSAKEVADMLEVPVSTLRYWEREFPQLRPKVTANKARQYAEKDIAIAREIRSLVMLRGFKTRAARKYLHENREGVDPQTEILERLVSVRDQLRDLKSALASLE